MKLERLHESVVPTVVIGAGLALAVYMGLAISTGGLGMVGLVILIIFATAAVLVARERVWMLIPALWPLGGKVSVLPLPFTIAQLGVMFALGVFLILKALKVIRYKPKFGILELWVAVVLVYLATVFLRNPVGVDALGSDRVGGRPYFDVVISAAGLWVLTRVVATPRQALFLPFLTIAGHGFHALINTIANQFPSAIGPLSRLYSGIDAAATLDGNTTGPSFIDQGGRFAHFQGFGSSMFLAAISFWRPSTLINPFLVGRFLMVVISLLLVLFAGYRSAFLSLMAFALMSSYFRRGTKELLSICFVGFFSLTVLILLQGTVIQLPYSAQRALSFLPGKWDYAAKQDAENSTEWRVDMWKTIMTGNKYIENKWLGDGFGFTKSQLQIMAANALTGDTYSQRENLMINGNVHSGPITAIRYTGYVGLVLYVILMGMILWRSAQLIRRATNTPFFPMALFIGLPAIFHPFYFVVIFGAYDIDLPTSIINVGLLRMLENSLDKHAAADPKPVLSTIQRRPPLSRGPSPAFAPRRG